MLEKAWSDLASQDLETLAKNAKARFHDDGLVTVPFFCKEYSIDRVGSCVTRVVDGHAAHPYVAALILHYLMGAKDIELTGRYLTFRELEGGEVYYQAFYRRAIQPLATELGNSPQLLLERAERVKGERLDLGDASVKVQVFPRIPVVAVVWQGDDEVPSAANILFDSTAGHHLHTEDLAAIGDIVADSLILSDEEWRGW